MLLYIQTSLRKVKCKEIDKIEMLHPLVKKTQIQTQKIDHK